MTYVINTIESISELALAIYDEQNEVLKEVTIDDLVLPVYANKRIIKRFYLIGDLLYDGQVSVKVETDTSKYGAKVIIGKDSPRFSDFIEYSDYSITSYQDASIKFLNALPVDICIESHDFVDTDVMINITIGVEK